MDTVTIIICALAGYFLVVMLPIILVSSHKKSKAREKERQIEAKHQANLHYLYQMGFRIEEQYHPQETSLYIYYDYSHRNAALEYFSLKSSCSDLTIFPINKIVECDLVQNGSVISREEGKITGATAFGYGAMGGTKQSTSVEMGGVLAIRLVIDDMRIPSVTINVLELALSKASQEYQKFFFIAQEVYGRFQGIVRINNAERQQQSIAQAPKAAQLPENIMDQIRKLGQLKDDGILTEQEFNAKKQLLMDKIT